MYILMILITRAEPCHFLWIQNAVCSVSVWYKLVGCWLVTLADALSLFSTGNRFCYLSLTALPVDYKALGKEKKKKKNTPSLVLLDVFFSPFGVSSARVEAKTFDETPVPGKWKKWFKSPSPRKAAAPSSGICSPAAWRSALPQGNSSAEPFQTPCGFIYTYFHNPFLYVTAASEWRRVTKNVTGFPMDARSGATAQNKASPVSCLRYALLKWHFTQGVPLQWYKYIFFLD